VKKCKNQLKKVKKRKKRKKAHPQLKTKKEKTMKIYLVCPVRNVTKEQIAEIDAYVEKIEKEGHEVHYPPRDVNQDDETGINIVEAHKNAMMECDRVDIFWDKTSTGSHFDLGMAFMSNKPIKLIRLYQEDSVGKSYVKVMKILETR
jgi:nucleoside 2-deoxyribosyltransferase